MQSRRYSCLASIILVLLCGSFAAAQNQPSRISQQIDARRMSALKGNVNPLARAEFDQGALAPDQVLNRVTIFFQRTAAQQQDLEKLLADQHDPTSANYRNWLTPEQFGERFGASAGDVTMLKDWLVSQGFTINEVARGRGWITFSGSAGQIASAFQTELHQYAVNGKVHYANGTEPAVPAAVSGLVAGFRNLNDFRPRARAVQRLRPRFTSNVSGNHYIAPDDFARMHNLNGLYAAGIDGTGQKVAVMGQTDIKLTDIATFRSVSGLSANVPTVMLVPGSKDPGIITDELGEASLDVEWAGAVARNAQIIYVNSDNGVLDSLQYAINQNLAPVLSISYGACEPTWSSSDLQWLTSVSQQANAQGQTIVAPSGDDGAADCDYPTTSTPVTVARQGLAVDLPAGSPYVTGIGGTTFNEGNGTYWSTTNNSLNGSALYYIPEVAWNDTTYEIANGGSLSASGGGVSINFAKPSWQTGTGVPADGARDVPDVSFGASVNHDGFLICSNGDCVNGYRYTDSTLDVVGGTSIGVPLFAGMVTLLNQKMGVAQGNVNPRLYALSSQAPYVFHDITSGDNKVPCQAGTTDCPNGGTIGYTTGTGYDLVTGLGSVDGYNLVNNWSSVAAADFGLEMFNTATITLSRGASTTMPVILRRRNGFNGTVTLSCSISGVTGATCSVSPNSVSPDGAVTMTIVTTTSASSHPSPLLPWWESAFGVAAFFGMAQSRRLNRKCLLLGGLTIVLVFALASCGGGGGSSSSSNSLSTTTSQTGTVVVQATSGSISHSAQVAITVN